MTRILLFVATNLAILFILNILIAALRRLGSSYGEERQLPSEMAAFAISGRVGGGFAQLFRSHPPLEDRIAALGAPRGEMRR